MGRMDAVNRAQQLFGELDERDSRRGGSGRTDLSSMVAELRPGDGIDPRYDRKERRDKTDLYERRSHQLGKQIEHALSQTIGTFDSDLGGLQITSVKPVKGSNCFEVTLQPGPASGAVNITEMQQKLNDARRYLREEVAGAISRKFTPDLRFRVVPPGEG